MVGTPLAVPRGPEEGTRGGQNAYVLGWGRVCDADGKSCSGQNDQATTIQVKYALSQDFIISIQSVPFGSNLHHHLVLSWSEHSKKAQKG